MNAQLEKYLAIEEQFCSRFVGMCHDDEGRDTKQFRMSLNDCIYCYLEEGWPEKLGLMLLEFGLDLEAFVKRARANGLRFSLEGERLQYKGDCSKVIRLLRTIAELL